MRTAKIIAARIIQRAGLRVGAAGPARETFMCIMVAAEDSQLWRHERNAALLSIEEKQCSWSAKRQFLLCFR
jgi:hypothetical protein